MTIAASATLGTSCSTPVSQSRKATTSSPAPTCASCVRIPAVSATAVRDWLDEEGKPREQSRSDVPDSERYQFLVGVERLPVALGERASGEDRLREADEREAAGERDQRADVAERHLRHRESGEAGRHRPDDRDAFGCKLEQRDGAGAENQRGERTGEPWPEPSQDGQHDQEDHAERDRAPLRVADVSDNAPERSERAVGLDLDPEQLRQLADDDDHRHPVDEPEQDRSREEVGEEPEPRAVPERISTAPVSSASIAASTANRAEPSAASGASESAVRIASPDSGPTISRRELANSGYRTSGASAA